MCYGWRWSSWKDLSSYFLHQQHFPHCKTILLFFYSLCVCDLVEGLTFDFSWKFMFFVKHIYFCFCRIMFQRFLIILVQVLLLMAKLWIWVCGILLVHSFFTFYMHFSSFFIHISSWKWESFLFWMCVYYN